MAERRMFAKTIVLSDDFLDMPLTARCLYFTLGMFADDDGFVNSPKGIMRQCGASQDDLKILLSKKFIIAFESGVIVIKHWRINNYLRADRYQSTKYVDEKEQLVINENGSYSFGIPNSGIPSIDKDSIGKNSIDKDKDIYSSETIHEIIDYLNKVCGTHYRYGDKTIGLIKTRMKEGFTIDDFKKVIDKKFADWGKGDMAKYLRPETLFGTKFEGYLNEKGSEKDESAGSNEGSYSKRSRELLARRGIYV